MAAPESPRRFAYYNRLSAKQKATYRKSDEAPSPVIPDPSALMPLIARLDAALTTGKRLRVASATTELADALLAQLDVAPVKIFVRLVRPHTEDEELHGLYTYAQDGEPPKLEVWMRTAAKAKVVRFRTFLRTVMHELAHHLDVMLLGLPDSFHTEGFFRRESSLVRQLVTKREAHKVHQKKATEAAIAKRRHPQLVLFDDRQLSLFV